MKKIILVLLILSATGLHAQSLEEYLKIAEENNPGLKSLYAEFEATLQKIPQVKSLPDPSLSMSAFGQMIETRVGPQRAVFILNQMFPWFGTNKARGEVAALMAEARLQAWLDARNELFYKVKAAWYPFYELDQTIKYQYENKAILETYKSLALSRFKNGKGSMVDVIRVDIMLSDLLTKLTILEEKRKPLRSAFNQLLNLDMESVVVVSDTLVPNWTTPILPADSLLKNNPRLTELDKKIQLWEAQGALAQKEGMPKLGVGMNYTIIAKRTDVDIPDNGKDAIMPMVSVSLPIYRNKYRAAEKETNLMQYAMEEKKQDIRNDLLATYDMTTYKLESAEAEYELYTKQMEKTSQATQLLLSAYTNSGENLEEVLRMQQLSISYKIALATATTAYFTAKARLDYLTGNQQDL